MLEPSLVEGLNSEDLSERSGIPLDRIEQLLNREQLPTIYEIGEIAEALSVDPMYVVRPRPALLAARDSGVNHASLSAFLEALDLHVAAYAKELGQELIRGFPAGSGQGARRQGEGWALQRSLPRWRLNQPDPLIEIIESQLRIPVLIWPVPQAPFGATLRLDGVVAFWVNSADVSGAQQRFTLAHELGHLMLDHVRVTRVEASSSVERPERTHAQSGRIEEEHAQSFAGGVLYNYDDIQELWDHEVSAPSIATLAANLGISFQAAQVGIRVHTRVSAGEIRQAVQGWSAARAFRAADVYDAYQAYEGQRDRRRLPGLLRHTDVLERSLAEALTH